MKLYGLFFTEPYKIRHVARKRELAMANKVRLNYSDVWGLSSGSDESLQLFNKLFEFIGKDSQVTKFGCVNHNIDGENKLIGFYFMKKAFRWKKLDAETYHAYFVFNSNLNTSEFDFKKDKEIFRSESGARKFIRQKYKESRV